MWSERTMADLAVTTHQHVPVAPAARSGSSGSDAGAAFVSSFEQLLQGGIIPRRSLPPAADGLRVERDERDRAAGRPAEDRARPIRKRIEAKPAQTIDLSRHADAAAPVRREADHDRAASVDTDAASERPNEPFRERSRERADRRRAADPAEGNVQPPAAAETGPAAAGMPATATTQSPGPATQAGAPASAAPGTSWPLFSGAADSAEFQQVTTAPAPGQAAASVTRDADMLVSQPAATLAPAAVIAAESLHGQGLRLRASSSGPASGAMSEHVAAAVGAGEAATDPGADVPATPGVAARAAGGPQTAHAATGTAVAGGANAAAGIGLDAGQGQIGQRQMAQGQQSGSGPAATAISAAADGAAPPSAGTAVDARGPAGIAGGAVIGGAQALQQAGQSAGSSAVAPGVSVVQQRMIGDQVSVHIRKAVHEGSDRIEIRLKPEALGRVDVRLELGADNRVVATVTAEQRHTLELLRADARNLERALQEAGLQTDGGSLNFNLRGGDDGRPGRHDGHATGRSLHDANATGGENVQELPPQAYGRPAGRPDGIDIRA
jgi:flagellar hook-length control protein FliK